MNYPTYVIINGERYDINTDFRVAIECNQIALDDKIGDYERALAVIYKIFGDKGLNNKKDHCELLKSAIKFLSCGEEKGENGKQEKPDMDYVEDYDYIEASFMSDYHIDLSTTQLHWWKFFKLLNGLSNSETGNCCILNRVRNIRNIDLSDIKDPKERSKIREMQDKVALKKYDKKNNLTKEQEESIMRLEQFMKKRG